jgi:hypothetical protein
MSVEKQVWMHPEELDEKLPTNSSDAHLYSILISTNKKYASIM